MRQGRVGERHSRPPPFKPSFPTSHLSPPSQGLGGVRLEDDVLITATGAEPLAAAPRSVAEVEAVLAGGAWPPREGAAA